MGSSRLLTVWRSNPNDRTQEAAVWRRRFALGSQRSGALPWSSAFDHRHRAMSFSVGSGCLTATLRTPKPAFRHITAGVSRLIIVVREMSFSAGTLFVEGGARMILLHSSIVPVV